MSRKLEKPQGYKFHKSNKINKWMNDNFSHGYAKEEDWIVYLKGAKTKKSSHILNFHRLFAIWHFFFDFYSNQ